MTSANFLQNLYDQAINQDNWMFSEWYRAFERAVNRFRAAATSGVWNDDDISDLIRAKSNGIADYGQGALRENDRLSITKDWAQITPRLKDLCLASKEEIPEICDDIRNWLKSKTTRSYKVVFNRLFAAFLPNVVSTAADESDFYGMIRSLRKKVDDYPEKQDDWVRDNISFIDYCNEKVHFKTPWHSSIFAWYLKEYFDKKDEGEKKIMGEVEQMGSILNLKKNIILQGAPGTGKTYNTAALALSILGVKDVDYSDHEAVMNKYNKLLVEFDDDGNIKNDGQIGFVTFHQSMDYEDFVEGIKPVVDKETDTMLYDVRSGIFKSLCEKAATLNDSMSFNEAFKKLIDKIPEADEDPFKLTTTKGKIFGLTRNSHENLNIHTGAELKKQGVLTKENVQKYLLGDPSIDYWRSYFGGVATELKKPEYGYVPQKKPNDTKYVLVVDEINRGNVSKIFGELITLLEADKRKLVGADNVEENRRCQHEIEVTLPYSKDKFSVPSNLYIIGTMNTTDRSVGSIDYAVRRRFAFYTLKADRKALDNYYSAKDGKLKEIAIDRYNRVEKFLSDKNNLSNDMEFNDLMVGHSYFMAKTLKELDLKWNYEIVPLLKEYQKDGLLRQSINIEDVLNASEE